ncbi:hypothetical protein EDB81DRAFT_878324 [Dactylonectria macrodidyma]|uniref:Uncharacterized protein n=1 Tax=Dactylonectria macrodidyma TaxID=307937 RepID=A0A9P9JG51_9HYPO|nr:hypothetical protein EDB81DRAFT_878324 [Dactylonectria macrodidyma]
MSQRQLPAMYISNTVPDIHDDTIIVAATHPDVENGHPDRDGWFLSDFYAFNYLLKGKGASQVWLTAVDPHELFKPGCGTEHYLHGDTLQERKVVLCEELLDSDELTPVTIVKNTSMIDRFLQEEANIEPTIPSFDNKHSRVWYLLGSRFLLAPHRPQGPYFNRFKFYLTAAVVEAGLSEEVTTAMADRAIELMQAAKDFNISRASRDPVVIERGMRWIHSLGR